MAELRRMYIDSILNNSDGECSTQETFLESLSLEELEELVIELAIEKAVT
jgi:signal recognition particle subunit SEC65